MNSVKLALFLLSCCLRLSVVGLKRTNIFQIKSVQHVFRVALSVLLGWILSSFFQLDFLEFYFMDQRQKWSPRAETSGQVALVALDRSSVKEIGGQASLSLYTEALKHIAQGKPKHIVLMLKPHEIQAKESEKQEFAKLAEQVGAVIGIDDLPDVGQELPASLPPPFENIKVGALPTTKDNTVYAKDGVTRRVIVEYEHIPTYQQTIAREFNGLVPDQYHGAFSFLQSTQLFVRYRPQGHYPMIPLLDAAKGKVVSSIYENKIVLIGVDSGEFAADYIRTPFSKEILAMSQLEFQANALDTMIMNQAPKKIQGRATTLLTILLILITTYIMLEASPIVGICGLLLMMLSYITVSLLAFIAAEWMLPVATPLLGVFMCYYMLIPYRLVQENKKSFEYEQRNRLLTEVEELKSNFLRMMSHDLKTPLSRILGMAQVIAQEPKNLSEAQTTALQNIKQFTLELSDFIGSVLNLTRIESKEVKLQLKSRDINQIIQSVVKKSSYLAQRKDIELILELEPLFSTKVDEDLMGQVFTNILENAIKYSPNSSKILISTEEHNGEVVIQIADQGIGIDPHELPHIFDRFYRSEKVKNTETLGSGLGLHLAQYFVELHKGHIEAESEIGKGSTFTVRLPIDSSGLRLERSSHDSNLSR